MPATATDPIIVALPASLARAVMTLLRDLGEVAEAAEEIVLADRAQDIRAAVQDAYAAALR